MVRIYYSPKFAQMYRRLSLSVKLATEVREQWFRANPFDPRLKTHKLSGKLKDYWAFSVDYHYRIIFSFVSDGEVRFHAVGTHSIYE